MKYTVTQIESLTGISSHSLRMWERRYTFIKANRTNTNIRFYTDEQLRKLLNVSILLKNGFQVSSIDQMDAREIDSKVYEISNKSFNLESNTKELILSMIELNEEKFFTFLN